MHKFTEAVVSFVKREDGPTAIEYAVVLSLIVVICLAAIVFVGTGSSDIFTVAGSGAETP